MIILPDTAVGAVVAALIAGLISLLGLVISKEQKVSDFRQAWIEGLRTEMVEFLAQINAVRDAINLSYKEHSEKVKLLSPHFVSLNKATFSILLRLNEKEELSKNVIGAMETFNKLVNNNSQLTIENIRKAEEAFLTSSQKLLKSEWNRVKKGETIFRWTRRFAVLTTASAASGLIYIFYTRVFP